MCIYIIRPACPSSLRIRVLNIKRQIILLFFVLLQFCGNWGNLTSYGWVGHLKSSHWPGAGQHWITRKMSVCLWKCQLIIKYKNCTLLVSVLSCMQRPSDVRTHFFPIHVTAECQLIFFHPQDLPNKNRTGNRRTQCQATAGSTLSLCAITFNTVAPISFRDVDPAIIIGVYDHPRPNIKPVFTPLV